MFWELENINNNNLSLIDEPTGRSLTYKELISECDLFSACMKSGGKKLVMLFCDNSVQCIIAYLSALRTGQTVFLVNTRTVMELKEKLINLYNPEIIISTQRINSSALYGAEGKIDDLFIYQRPATEMTIHEDLALLLSTSGTTGSPKLVRLSYENIQANALSIAEYMALNQYEKPITSLPMSYSYGLSVINSHILKGASILCTNKSMVMRNFWEAFSNYGCTSFSGVPYNYKMLMKLNFDKMQIPGLKTITQAGGHLNKDILDYFYDISLQRNIRFFVMYGQTEATARISYVPPEKLSEKRGSVGIPVPKGEIKIYKDGIEIKSPNIEGELVYSGPNVMMGYADSRNDLMKPDELKGILNTGDLAYKDTDGYFYITGKLKRFIKLFGLRVNLDEIEKMLESTFPVTVACFGTDDLIKIIVESSDENIADVISHRITEIYKIHHSAFKVKCIKTLPVLSSGKKDYPSMHKIIF